jgi:hypothetical protein
MDPAPPAAMIFAIKAPVKAHALPANEYAVHGSSLTTFPDRAAYS